MLISTVIFLTCALAFARAEVHGGNEWMMPSRLVDVGYNEDLEQWYKHSCRKIRLFRRCAGAQGGLFLGNDCFKPTLYATEYNEEHGWHKYLECQTSSKTDYVVLSADRYGTPLAVGTGVVGKLVYCNGNGKWMTKSGERRVLLKEVFCYVVPKYTI